MIRESLALALVTSLFVHGGVVAALYSLDLTAEPSILVVFPAADAVASEPSDPPSPRRVTPAPPMAPPAPAARRPATVPRPAPPPEPVARALAPPAPSTAAAPPPPAPAPPVRRDSPPPAPPTAAAPPPPAPAPPVRRDSPPPASALSRLEVAPTPEPVPEVRAARHPRDDAPAGARGKPGPATSAPVTLEPAAPARPGVLASSPAASSRPGSPPMTAALPSAPAAPGPRGDGAPAGSEGPAAAGPLAPPTGGYQVRPRYPEAARRLGVEGTTFLKVRVHSDGRVGEVVVARSAGDPSLDEAAVAAVERWRFEPARRGGRPVPVWVTLPVRFELR